MKNKNKNRVAQKKTAQTLVELDNHTSNGSLI